MKIASLTLKNWKASPTIALIALVGVCAVWGSTFLIVQNAIGRMPVMDFLAIRFTVAAIVMIVLRPTCLRGMTLLGLWRAIGLGIVLGLGYITQTYGLLYASATVSGFITGMFVVFTPIMSWVLLQQKINRNTLLAVVLATVGLALLSLHGWSVGIGELLTLGCAIFYAIHIVGLGEWSSKYEPYGFSLLQIATVAVITPVTASPGGITMPPDAGTWGIVGITAILATAIAFLVQTWAISSISDNCCHRHDHGACFYRIIRRIHRSQSSDSTNHFGSNMRTNSNANSRSKINIESIALGKLISTYP
jgi:drug/metabolite transporter (DMT)-like permease